MIDSMQNVAHRMQNNAADFTLLMSSGLKYAGAGSLFMMAVVGTVALDIVIIAALCKDRDENRHRHGHNRHRHGHNRHRHGHNHHHHHCGNDFITGYLWGSMFSRESRDPLPLLLASPLITASAVVLSFVLGVPEVGLILMAGWCIAASLLLLGYCLEGLGEAMKPNPKVEYVQSPAPSAPAYYASALGSY